MLEDIEDTELIGYKMKKAHRNRILKKLVSVRQDWAAQVAASEASVELGEDPLTEGAEGEECDQAETVVDEALSALLTNRLLRELERYSLISRTARQTFSSHRLLLQVQQDDLRKGAASECQQALRACARMMQHTFGRTFKTDDYTTWATSSGLEAHVATVLRAIEGDATLKGCGASLLHALGELHYSTRGAYATAKPMFMLSLAMRREVHGGEDAVHADIAASMHAIGNVFDREGKYAEARGWYEGSLAMRREVYGGEDAVHADIASSMHQIGNVFGSEGKYAEARGWLERSLAMEREVHGGDLHFVGMALTYKLCANVCLRLYEFEAAGSHAYAYLRIAMARDDQWRTVHANQTKSCKEMLQAARSRDTMGLGIKCKPNEPCFCGSAKKFKKCHGR
jgi:tetratricopeptide (TPR) repeat protein